MVFGFLKKLRGEDDIIKPQITVPTSKDESAYNEAGKGCLEVDDVFVIAGRGTVVTGRVISGTFRINQEVVIEAQNGQKRTQIVGIEAFRKTIELAQAGDNVGLLLANVKRDDVQRGDKIIGE